MTILPGQVELAALPMPPAFPVPPALSILDSPARPPVAENGQTRERDGIFSPPRDAARFQCIGPACEDSCCKAWDVRLDRATYEHYRLIPVESLLGRVVKSSVVQMPEPRSESAYARILLNEALECPFLTSEKWCGIQQQFGEEALSRTCRTYPRIEQKTPEGRTETTLHLSCPEAARLILLDEGAERKHPEEADYEAVAELSSSRMATAHQDERTEMILGATRGFLRLLLRDRRYSLGERMLLMGLFAGRLREVLSVDQAETGFPVLLREFCLLVGKGTLRPALACVAGQPVLQLDLTLGLVNQRLERVMNSMRFLDDVKQFLDGIGYRPGRTHESLAPALQQAENEFFAPWMEAHPWFLENYLVHGVERSLFPFGKEAGRTDPEALFQIICTHFVVIRTLLTGISRTRGASFSTEHGVHLVQAYSRMMDHHAEFLEASSSMLARAHRTDAGSLAELLLEGVRGRRQSSAGAGTMA